MSDDEQGFSADERAAMKETAAERRAQAKRAKAADKEAADLQDVLDKIAEMPDDDRALAERIHAIVGRVAPELAARTWYGMPAYTKAGKVVCFFKPAGKFKSRYATLGFEDAAALDDGALWPTSLAVLAIGDAEEQQIADLIARAAG
ncbi:iron chaperone [Demequina mangrovi]|uniref:Uncharacterized conserved protein YdhG, YjbR/CyaY-like superfamily, DUF1801 family n=1 Tax=Demequina mangrovi TaxID=1043493 RepID=A0A1H7AKK3_9MICO|nr:DUF1801 domain-containing protein [Demequina mangrovi]SEJ66171.1 Uncharacterized conserved protein YdhG, YjbR/CyaY-like superfamily, DUF1801 family [Demequina mangrovi]